MNHVQKLHHFTTMPPRPPRPGPPPLDLKHFMLRSEALHLYRAFLRVASRAPVGGGGSSSPRAELAATIRAEFERAKKKGGESGGREGGREKKKGGGEDDSAAVSTLAIKHAIADGKLQLKRLEEMLGMQR